MITVRMMQVAVDQIVNVITVRYCFVPASWPVDMPRFMAAAVMARRALVRIFRADLEPVFVHMITMRMMQMSIMQIIDMIAVPDGGMATVRAMLVVVVGMMGFVAGAHGDTPRFSGYCPRG